MKRTNISELSLDDIDNVAGGFGCYILPMFCEDEVPWIDPGKNPAVPEPAHLHIR